MDQETRPSVHGKGVNAYTQAAALALAETLWPSRCAVCGRLGAVLCDGCRNALGYVDLWLACPRCGAPWGLNQCTECCALSLEETGYDRLPFQGCVCAVRFDDASASIVRLHKDGGERRLAGEMALAMACAIPPEWLEAAVVTYVPATNAARRRRGFDHGQAIGQALGRVLGLPCMALLEAPRSHDQRELSRQERFKDLSGAFSPTRKALSAAPSRAILADDVMTTGATMCAAARTLRRAGVGSVRAVGFARVY